MKAARAFIAGLVLVAGFSAVRAAPDSDPEPPPPKSSPVVSVMEESLPRAGGVLVFGGSRGLGLEVVKQLIDKKEQVTVLARASSDTAALKALGANVVTGDALEPETLKEAFTAAPFRAVISTLGGHDGDYRVDAEGNKNVVDATKNAGLERIIMVSALGAGDSVVPWYAKWYLKDYFAAKTTAENYLAASDLNYTIIRPGLLLDSDKTGEPALAAAAEGVNAITRTELAKLIAGSVGDMGTYKKTFAAIDAKRQGLWALLTY